MLLPSDVARLVLGYLQEEGLSATSQAFIHESPNLKEYAEHTTEDGAIPACVFSLFGKSLTTILNEYVAAKAKETTHEVPPMMTSLWKKLDITLNQIRSLQNSPALSSSQRVRSRMGLANVRRQRALTQTPTGSVVCPSTLEPGSIISPVHTSHSMLGHSTPVNYPALQSRPASSSSTHLQIQEGGGRVVNMFRDSPVQMLVSEHRLIPGPMSPGRRKWDSPRRRGGGLTGSSSTGRSTMTVSGLAAEPPGPEEVVDENFPQLVIQNAREKILGDRSLQEKLAENINKILASDPTPQTSKASCGTVEPDQSIDEILGLQGEIHMSDDAIHDILEQTESDPAFQALFDLFDYNKTRINEAEPGDGDISSSPEESDTAGPSSIDRAPQNEDTGIIQRDAASVPDATPSAGKVRTGQELKSRKTRKCAALSLSKKTVLGRGSRIENSTAKLLVDHEQQQDVSSSAAVDSNRVEKGSLFSDNNTVEVMDVDGPLNTPPPPSDSTATSVAPTESTTIHSASNPAATEPTLECNVDKTQEDTQAQEAEGKTDPQAEIKEQSATAPSCEPGFASPVPDELNKTPTLTLTATLPQVTGSVPSSAEDAQPVATSSVSSLKTASTTSSSVSALVSTMGSSQNKGAADPSNVVSLKIIISDNQDEAPPSNSASNSEASTVSGEKIPTIFLSSPAKPPEGPGASQANLDETAQAVNSLQCSEVLQAPTTETNPLSEKAGMVVTSPLAGTSEAQPSYIIQLPLDTANSALPGATASYFLVTNPPTTDPQARQVLVPAAGIPKGQPLPTPQYSPVTPPRAQGYPTGSALILQSPVPSMMLPVSVMGQNTLGKIQMVSNQLVAIPSPAPVQQSETLNPPTVALKQPAIPGAPEQNLVSKVVQSVPAENPGQQKVQAGTSPNHRRILCFDSSREATPSNSSKTSTATTPPTANKPVPLSVQLIDKDKIQRVRRTKPAILGGNKPKRRIETVRCSDSTQTGLVLVKEKTMAPQQHQKEVRRTPRKQDHKIHDQKPQSASPSTADTSQTESSKSSESGDRSKSLERKHKNDHEAKSKDTHSSRSLSADYTLKSVSKKDKEDGSRKEPADKAPAKPREGRTEKRTPSQELPNVMANKENEVEGGRREQQQQSTLSPAPRDFSPPAVSLPTPNPQTKSTKAPSKTTSLAKQAAEMLQDIQGLNSPSTPSKRPGMVYSPGSGRNPEESVDGPRTPARQRQARDGEGTPKHLMPPNTPDLPTCSPASEAGSENSINMAAHTLMILSRAAIARTGTPLKDSLRQEGAEETSSATSKISKKRKQSTPTGSPPSKKESKRSSNGKKDKKQKILDCFPDDLDVDKFLSSLHYDE
ncbi:protein NPAT isoform X2 [Myripristis murdjan]|uniref:protein NPAT isoform X2 n=1 Tax=Myripristis murdjan TaxID=586833 RepID=UPI001175E1F1|nr:protein NPAT isoform X2 [Myripristis murdjan]